MTKESDKFLGTFVRQVGKTTFTVHVYSAAGATETLEQKLRRMIRREAEMLLMEEETEAKPSKNAETDNNV